MNGNLSIKIKIDNREYPIKVTPEEESKLRLAGKLINKEIEDFKNQFGIEDKQDILSMVLFKTYVERIELEEKRKQELQQLDSNLDEINSLFPPSFL